MPVESRQSSDPIPLVATESQSPPPSLQFQPTTAEISNEFEPGLPEISQRLFYLEKIVRHKFGVQDLDLPALRALSSEARQQDGSIRLVREQVAPDDAVAAADEKCSVQPIEHNVARQPPHSVVRQMCS